MVSDPSPTPLPGSPAGTTKLNDSVIQVPVTGDDLNPLEQPFEDYANSVLAEIQKLLRRLRSQKLYTNTAALTIDSDWEFADGFDQKVRIISEVWAYGAFTVTAKSHIPADNLGNFTPQRIGTLPNPVQIARSNARLWSAQTGRLCAGHTDSSGNVYVDAINSSQDINVGDTISLTGMWPLLNGYDSESG